MSSNFRSQKLRSLALDIGDETVIFDLTKPNDVIDGARLQEWEGVGPFLTKGIKGTFEMRNSTRWS